MFRPASLLALALLACTLTTVVSATPVVIFSDSFTSGPSAMWGNEFGSWYGHDGVYDALYPENLPPTYTSLPFDLTDFTLDVDIQHLQDGGIWLRTSDQTHGVLLVTGGHLRTGTGLYWHVPPYPGTNWPILNEVTGLFTPGVSNAHLRVVVHDSTFSAYVDGNPVPATTLVTSVHPSGRVALYDFSGQTFDNVVLSVPSELLGVAEAAAQTRPTLAIVGPLPCRAGATIAWSLPPAAAGAPVRLDLLDVSGRRVCTLLAGMAPGLAGAVRWDGHDAAGRVAPSGVYFCRLVGWGAPVGRRLVLAR